MVSVLRGSEISYSLIVNKEEEEEAACRPRSTACYAREIDQITR